MLKNYIKIALRRLTKHKVDSAISIGGLAVGIACCLLLILSVRFEFTYDDFHNNKAQIYRVTDTYDQPSGDIRHGVIHPFPMASALDSSFPEIKDAVRMRQSQLQLKQEGNFHAKQVLMADPGFFEMFTFPLISGDKETVLSDQNNVVLSESMAEKLFGTRKAIGKYVTLRMNNKEYDYRVTGIAEDVPANSTITFDIVIPFENMLRATREEMRKTVRNSWYVGNSLIWILLNEKASPKDLEEKFPTFVKKHFGAMADARSLGLQPLEDVYFSQKYTSAVTESADLQYTLILAGIALIILAIAGMNFMSLTLSRIDERQHAIGIRKAAGAGRKQLVFQVLGEIFVTCTIALMIGLALFELLTPYFRQFTQKPVHTDLLVDPVAWLLILSVIPVLTVIIGLYPAITISTKKASHLFGSPRTAENIPGFVKGLIVVQFALTISFMIATFFMKRQLNYLYQKDLGFSAEEIISVDFRIQSDRNTELARIFKREARRLPNVVDVSIVSSPFHSLIKDISPEMDNPTGMIAMKTGTRLEGLREVSIERVDENYLNTMNLELVAGRNFSSERPSDIKRGIIVNEELVKRMELDHPVGHSFSEEQPNQLGSLDGKKIIGVVENFHFQPLYKGIQPLMLMHLDARERTRVGTILVRVPKDKKSELVTKLRDIWESVIPQYTFNYAFLDDLLSLQYRSQQQWSRIMQAASFLAIVLACFGLFGLASMATQRRTREIGIRKVMGATTAQIVWLLNKDFMKLVLIGFALAIPVAWYAVNRWLEMFAYKIDPGASYFIAGGGIAVLIALVTVSWQSIRAAASNPADSIRNE